MFTILPYIPKEQSKMNKWPPIEKIHEAYSAIADERVVLSEGTAKVASSNRAKEYRYLAGWNLYFQRQRLLLAGLRRLSDDSCAAAARKTNVKPFSCRLLHRNQLDGAQRKI